MVTGWQAKAWVKSEAEKRSERKVNEKTRRKTPDPASTGLVDPEPDQRIHNGPK